MKINWKKEGLFMVVVVGTLSSGYALQAIGLSSVMSLTLIGFMAGQIWSEIKRDIRREEAKR